MMWKNTASLIGSVLKNPNILLSANELLYQQTRTTFILKRKYPAPLHKKGHPEKRLRTRFFVYDLVKDTSNDRQPTIEVVLTAFVEGLGNVGDKVSVKSNVAYNKLLLPGLAVYANPENETKYKKAAESKDVVKYSSATVVYTMKAFSRMVLSVVMNKETPWTLQPWHIKASFRKCGYFVPEETITLPDTPITGPDMNLENKEFAISVKINKQETVNVRCRIHHWSTEVATRIPYVYEFWEIPAEPLLPEQASLLETMPKKPPTKSKIAQKST